METVNFAFMKFFDSLVKITIFWAFLRFFWEIDFLPLHNLFMMLVHMEVHLKGYFSMSISLQKYTVCLGQVLTVRIWAQLKMSLHLAKSIYVFQVSAEKMQGTFFK